jgi:hypothetical protein
MTWQPIETAPLDKTMVALIHVDGGYVRYGVGWYMPLAGWQGWYHEAHHKAPTHWMPLPRPPRGFKPDEPIEDLSAHFALCSELKIAKP